ncbi:MAG: hypothetical protein R3242_05930, partial [Akkermansiaceae bacterium]|nr:hypothetical protein [Akkermansiaceae bacterium]
LLLVPLWLALSAAVAVWWSLRSDDQEEEERNRRYALKMSEERIAEDMRKFIEVIGPRNSDHPEKLVQAAAMIDGTLGPSNTGYTIKRIPGPDEAPVIRASLDQARNKGRPIWVMTSYDTAPGSQSIRADSSAVAALMGIAQTMSRDDLPTDIHFLFLPCGNDPDRPCEVAIRNLQGTMERPALVFYLETMDLGPDLLALHSGELSEPESESMGQLGRFSPRDQAIPIIHELEQSSLRILQIMSGNGLGEDAVPSAANVAITAGKLVEWLRRAARLEAAN